MVDILICATGIASTIYVVLLVNRLKQENKNLKLVLETYEKSDECRGQLIQLYQGYFIAALKDLIACYKSVKQTEEVERLTDVLNREQTLKEQNFDFLFKEKFELPK